MKVTVKEYATATIVSRRMLHYSMGYICPDKDICNICNWVPTPPTTKQRIKAILRKIRWNIGRAFGLIAYRLGYSRCDCPNGEDY